MWNIIFVLIQCPSEEPAVFYNEIREKLCRTENKVASVLWKKRRRCRLAEGKMNCVPVGNADWRNYIDETDGSLNAWTGRTSIWPFWWNGIPMYHVTGIKYPLSPDPDREAQYGNYEKQSRLPRPWIRIIQLADYIYLRVHNARGKEPPSKHMVQEHNLMTETMEKNLPSPSTRWLCRHSKNVYLNVYPDCGKHKSQRRGWFRRDGTFLGIWGCGEGHITSVHLRNSSGKLGNSLRDSSTWFLRPSLNSWAMV